MEAMDWISASKPEGPGSTPGHAVFYQLCELDVDMLNISYIITFSLTQRPVLNEKVTYFYI